MARKTAVNGGVGTSGFRVSGPIPWEQTIERLSDPQLEQDIEAITGLRNTVTSLGCPRCGSPYESHQRRSLPDGGDELLCPHEVPQ